VRFRSAGRRTVLSGWGADGPEDATWPQDPAKLAARARLGPAFATTGGYESAVDVLAKNLADTERSLGADHAATLVARHDLAWAWQKSECLAHAAAAHERCVADLDRVPGAGSAQALRHRNQRAGA
jgi:hypothetical protein